MSGRGGIESRSYLGPEVERRVGEFSTLDLEDVTLRVFPLRASLQRLENFVDQYLNMDVPPALARFRPAMPYVFFIVVNYGKMGPTASSLGWVSQNEVLFHVPVIGRWTERGETVEGYATVSPVIFVDNEWSIAAGREVYGWPKTLAWMAPEVDPWLLDPSRPRQMLTLKTLLFSRLYAGEPLSPRVLLEVRHRERGNGGRFPPDLSRVLQPWLEWPQAWLETAAGFPAVLGGFDSTGPGGAALAAGLSSALGAAARPGGSVTGNLINLKQFRSSKPSSICYQSLVNSPMVIRDVLGGGPLGAGDLGVVDPTGGFSLFVYRYDAYPLVDALGLQVARRYEWDGVPVDELRPVLPFWAGIDMRYELGRRICSRTQDSEWAPGGGEGLLKMTPVGQDRPTTTPYNTTLGPVAQAPEGPFDFYDATLRVLPLRAHSHRLAAGLPDLGGVLARLYPNQARLGDCVLEPWRCLPVANEGDPDCLVLLVASAYGRMSAAVNDVGWWARREVGIAVVLKTPLAGNEAGRSLYWLYWPCLFADSPIAVTEGREVLGQPTTFADLGAGEDPWMTAGGRVAPRRLLSVTTKDYPAVGFGQETRDQVLLEIECSPGEAAGGAGGGLLRRLGEEYGGGLYFSNLTLKQIRDEEKPDQVCYRAIVACERALGSWSGAALSLEVEPLEGTYSVRIHRSASFPLVEQLGLHADATETDLSGASVAVCRAVSPFWLTVDVRSELPTELAIQRFPGGWTSSVDGERYFDARLDHLGASRDGDSVAGPVADPDNIAAGGPFAPLKGTPAFLHELDVRRMRSLETLIEGLEAGPDAD